MLIILKPSNTGRSINYLPGETWANWVLPLYPRLHLAGRHLSIKERPCAFQRYTSDLIFSLKLASLKRLVFFFSLSGFLYHRGTYVCVRVAESLSDYLITSGAISKFKVLQAVNVRFRYSLLESPEFFILSDRQTCRLRIGEPVLERWCRSVK